MTRQLLVIDLFGRYSSNREKPNSLAMRKYHFTEIDYDTLVELRKEGDGARLCRLAEKCIRAEYQRLKMDADHADRSPFDIDANFQYVKNYIEGRKARYRRRREAIMSII